jgi:glycosyltransferase involved in cell wall biosynthesis
MVSVIIPNYNHSQFLEQRLKSVLDQKYQDIEIILLDDCSTDLSSEILNNYASHPKVSHLILNKKNSGSPFHQWKKGLELARGKYVWIAESDDYASPEFLRILIKEFEENPELGLCYCRSNRINEKDEEFGILHWGEVINTGSWENNRYFEKGEYVANYLRFRNTIPNVSAVLFKKDIFFISEEVKNMKLCGDWLLYVNLAFKYPVSYVSKPLNYFRRYSASTTFKNTSLKKERLRIKEYFHVINYANKISGRKLSQNIQMYTWICAEWINNKQLKKDAKLGYYFPNIPLSLTFVFYKMLILSLLRSVLHVSKKIR